MRKIIYYSLLLLAPVSHAQDVNNSELKPRQEISVVSSPEIISFVYERGSDTIDSPGKLLFTNKKITRLYRRANARRDAELKFIPINQKRTWLT